MSPIDPIYLLLHRVVALCVRRPRFFVAFPRLLHALYPPTPSPLHPTPVVSTTGHDTITARRGPCAGRAIWTTGFPLPAPPLSDTLIVAHIHEGFSYLYFPVNLLVEPPEHLPYSEAFRRVGHKLFSLLSRDGCDPPATTIECRMSATRAGAQSLLWRVLLMS